MALNLPVFYKRTASAIVFCIVMLTGLLWNSWSFLALITLINILCLREYFRLMQQIDKDTYWPKWLHLLIQALGLMLLLPYFLYTTIGSAFGNECISWLFIFWGILPMAFTGLLLVCVLSKKNFFMAALQALGGIFYITLSLGTLLFIYQKNSILPLALILMIWCNDTMAYLVGSFVGKTPFSPISPKKTWEGTIGGALLTIIGAGIYGYFSSSYRWADWMMLALCAAVAGTLGDLLESKLKRMAEIKDSGTLMPGHGGALDRFDSLLVAAPFAFVYVIYFMK
jgi:phosphatidate cytidylyltransferase